MTSSDFHLELLLEEIRQAVNSSPSDPKTARSLHERRIKRQRVDPLLDELLNRLIE